MFAASAEVVSGVSCTISGRVPFRFNYALRDTQGALEGVFQKK